MVEGLIKNVGQHGWATTKNKKHWLKRPKAVSKKRNLDQNINNSKHYIWNSFLENIILGIEHFHIRFSGHHQSLFFF